MAAPVMEITALHHVSLQKPQGRELLFPGTSPFSVLCSILAQNSCTRMLKPDLSTFVPGESCSLPAEQGLLTRAVLTCLFLKVSLSFKEVFSPPYAKINYGSCCFLWGNCILSLVSVRGTIAVLDAFRGCGVRVMAAIGVHGPNSANLTCCIIIKQSEVNFAFHFKILF